MKSLNPDGIGRWKTRGRSGFKGTDPLAREALDDDDDDGAP